jgi:predicted RecA/RadA family phage recombinase
MAYGFNDHGFYWQQGSGAKVPNVNNKFFKSRDEILLTLKVSGMNLDACCKVNQIEAHIRAIPLVKGDVIYVGATLYWEHDSISVLSNFGEK